MIKQKEQGILIVVSGPSGCGKSTIDQRIVKDNKNVIISVSDTTRKKRTGEVDGIDYNYISKDEFEANIKNNKYLEYAIVHSDNYYGTPAYRIDEQLNKGIDVILEIDIEGARKVNELRKDAVFIFIMPPSMSELKNRLIGRKTETKEQIVERFTKAYKEINEVSTYNYVIVNDDLEESIKKFKSILICEKCRVNRIEDIYLGNKEEMIHEILINYENEKD